MIHPKPLATINTKTVYLDSGYTTHLANEGLVSILTKDPADFGGILWFYPLSHITEIRQLPSIRAIDDLRTYAGTARANSIADSYLAACNLLKAWCGYYPITYMGQIDAVVDDSIWRGHDLAGTLEAELQRVLAFMPAGSIISIDSSGNILPGGYAERSIDYLRKTRTVYAEGPSYPGQVLWLRNEPNLCTMLFNRNIITDWNLHRTPVIIWQTQNIQDDAASPVDPGSYSPSIDYVSELFPLIKRGFKILTGYDHLGAWPPSWWGPLIDFGGTLTLTNGAVTEYGNAAGTAALSTVLKNSTQHLTLRIYNQTTGPVIFATTDPTITGAGSLTSAGTGAPTEVGAGEYLEFPLSLTTSATGNKSVGISIAHDRGGGTVIASPFTFTLTFTVIDPVGGRPVRPLIARR